MPKFANSDTKINSIVAELRSLRLALLEYRQRLENPPKLPSRKALANIIERLSAALFPNRLGLPDLTEEGIDHFVGYTLDTTLRDLSTEIQRELHFFSKRDNQLTQV